VKIDNVAEKAGNAPPGTIYNLSVPVVLLAAVRTLQDRSERRVKLAEIGDELGVRASLKLPS